jgi:hypothetical protein
VPKQIGAAVGDIDTRRPDAGRLPIHDPLNLTAATARCRDESRGG